MIGLDDVEVARHAQGGMVDLGEVVQEPTLELAAMLAVFRGHAVGRAIDADKAHGGVVSGEVNSGDTGVEPRQLYRGDLDASGGQVAGVFPASVATASLM